jgi:hypothetical protein
VAKPPAWASGGVECPNGHRFSDVNLVRCPECDEFVSISRRSSPARPLPGIGQRPPAAQAAARGVHAVYYLTGAALLAAVGIGLNMHFGPTNDVCSSGFGALAQEVDSSWLGSCSVAQFAVVMHWFFYVGAGIVALLALLVALGGED